MTIVGGVPRSGEEIQAALNKEITEGQRGYDPFVTVGDPS